MKRLLGVVLCLALLIAALPASADWKAVSDKTVSGFSHPESVAFDAKRLVLYVSNFGPELKPMQKDGKGFVSKLDLQGKVLEKRFLPPAGQTMDKPKGVWVKGDRLWTPDIDSVWIFDLNSKKGRKLPLPGAVFANDPVVHEGKLLVSDTGSASVYVVSPADFLNGEAKVAKLEAASGIAANGLAVNKQGELMIAASLRDGSGKLYVMQNRQLRPISGELGRLDGLAVLSDGTVIYTDWVDGGLFAMSAGGKETKLAGGFKGPADFAVIPGKDGFLVVVPDLVKSELRFIKLESK